MAFKADWDKFGKWSRELDNIQIDYRLNNLKPLQEKWLIDFYNLMSMMKGKRYD